jgi:hypothetical protein
VFGNFSEDRAMTLPEFWDLIDASRRGAADNPDLQMEQLRSLLAKLPAQEVLAFGALLYRLHAESYRGDLWGAAFLINGGCSDDGFDYFRAWLIAQGRSVYEAALANPDSLASVALPDHMELEELLGVPADVHERLTGRSDFYAQLPKAHRRDIPDEEFAAWSDGQGDTDEAKARRVYPRLFETFWE